MPLLPGRQDKDGPGWERAGQALSPAGRSSPFARWARVGR